MIADDCHDFSCKSDDMGVTQNTHCRRNRVCHRLRIWLVCRCPCLQRVIQRRRLMFDGSPFRRLFRQVKFPVPSDGVEGFVMELMSFAVVTDVDTQIEVGWEPTSVVHLSGWDGLILKLTVG